MSDLPITKKYVWKIPGKIYFTTLEIHPTEDSYKLIVDIRPRPFGIESDDISEYNTSNTIINTNWLDLGDKFPNFLQGIYENKRLRRYLSKLMFDYYELTDSVVGFNDKILLKRKYMNIPYTSVANEKYLQEFKCDEATEFWLCVDNDMQIYMTKFIADYDCLEIYHGSSILLSNSDSNSTSQIHLMCCKLDEEYPVGELFEWALRELYDLHKTKIHEIIFNIITIEGLTKLILSYSTHLDDVFNSKLNTKIILC
jgi:hypothetical protein